MQSIHLVGQVSLDENDLDRMNYIVTNPDTNEQQSITDILDTIYNNKNSVDKLIRIVGRILNNNHTFNGFSTLHMAKSYDGVMEYYIGNYKFGKQLYELAERNYSVEMVLEDYTSSIGEFIDATEDTTPYDEATTKAS